MGSVSIYLNDDDEEWVKDNIQNLSGYIQEKIAEDRDRDWKEITRLKKRVTLFQMISFFILGIALFAFGAQKILGEISHAVAIIAGILVIIIVGLGMGKSGDRYKWI